MEAYSEQSTEMPSLHNSYLLLEVMHFFKALPSIQVCELCKTFKINFKIHLKKTIILIFFEEQITCACHSFNSHISNSIPTESLFQVSPSQKTLNLGKLHPGNSQKTNRKQHKGGKIEYVNSHSGHIISSF